MIAAYWQELSGLLLLSGIAASLVRGEPVRKLAGMVIFLLLAFIPLGETNAWLWFKGLIGSLSVVSIALLLNFLVTSLTGKELLDIASRRSLFGFILVAGLVLYPATLGLILLDPYQSGYGMMIALIVLAVALVAWFTGRQAAAVVLALVVLADQAAMTDSLNTWDYLVDPLVWLASPVMLVRFRSRS